ncbi:GPR1/FUN34/yaaH family [Acididesulfobacillus acetoxydans]|uniref:GPR1/FUN34/yaaH family n=1 Tax=Acididesulfobacillus acetoxydans TaxID=1561005 RepID=A0A8S0W7S6_9FIRM|nr:acetate uptake transporter [Acididesulfobacillus acetoxydans]CAA7601079.1 GPR1/FUN34/yaaH family [Acididesulfobacillus acetoxydans]CEJ06953.1 GPR1/FUN34/yaaH protein [Acididesulfobacillus acetoxydans]
MAEVTEIRESSIADPGPLGLAGFALTTFILSMSNAQLVPAALGALFVPVALFYGGIAQILAGMWEFKKNNTFGAAAFTTYGAFWLSLASIIILGGLKLISFGSSEPIAIGLFLVGFTVFNTYMWIATFRLNNALLAVFTFLEITFILLDLANFGLMSPVAGGYFGIITAICAWYTSAAGVINPIYGRTVLPTGPRQRIVIKSGTAAK